MKVAIIASFLPSVLNFRRELVLELSRHGQVKIFAPDECESVTRAILALGVEYECIPIKNSGWNPFSDLQLMYRLSSQIKRFKPDCVLSYTIKPVIWGSIAAKRTDVKNIYSMITGLGYSFTEINTWSRKLIHWIVKKLYRNALRSNSKVFFQNPDDQALFIRENLVDKEKTLLINGSGVNLERFSIVPLPQEKVFLFIGRLLRDKGLYEYVNAARQIKKAHVCARFLIVGGLDANPSSIKKIELDRWLDEGVIEYKGKLNDVRPVIAESAIYVLPSYREGTPRSVLEAMSMGRPVITTDVPGCRETVIDGLNGFLVPVKNVDKLAEAMERFILHPDLVFRMGKESRRIAEEKFDVHKVNHVILKTMGIFEE
ncbi:MAG: hypothetical protein A2X77_04700 [Gammaproteobacteria bacterium GWE2_42_36]|nr:MAG: hypothetical protein A2X77_04700 [Gammaproteobacteria bacterium GWE2_42_36]